ncbi:MAG: class I SAM-dependent methyltransferase [Phycisphaerae bacterium]|nr:class I SAM-dependent methyltransferase [Phycisphaerae bacterium]
MFSLRSWLMAKVYDFFMRKAEKKNFSKWRSGLLKNLSGSVLEVGAGTGVNVFYYPSTFSKLTLTEPDPNMLKILRKRAKQRNDLTVEIHRATVEKLPFPDNSFDFVVCTFLLCSVFSPQDSLSEIFRVLKSGGKFVFLEHVANIKNNRAYKWQKRIEPIWKFVGGNCHMTRDTAYEIDTSGFEILDLDTEYIAGGASIINPFIRGVAKKI